jgi:hypothetical protein
MNKTWVQRSILASVVLLLVIFTNYFGVIAQDSPFHGQKLEVKVEFSTGIITNSAFSEGDHQIHRIIFKNIGFLLLGFSYSMVVWIPWGIIVMLRRFCPNCKGWKLEVIHKYYFAIASRLDCRCSKQTRYHNLYIKI